MDMKIYDFPLSPNCRKVRAVVYELGLSPELVRINPFKGEQYAPEVLALNPNARIPILVDGDFVLWESNAIAAYLAAGSPLLPASPRARADVERWCAWQLAHLGPAIGKVAFERLLKPMQGNGQPDPDVVERGKTEFLTFAAVLDRSLRGRDYVAGDLSIADFILASVLSVGTTIGLGVDPFPDLGAWLGRILARESMRRVLADVRSDTPR